MRYVAAGIAFGLAWVALTPGVARAQLHWDVGAQGGVMKRVLNGRAPGSDDAGLGPYGEVHAHVALLPLVRVGAYGSFDRSPQGSAPARLVFSGGVRGKVTPPWPRDPWRAWFFAGLGMAFASSGSYQTSAAVAPPGGSPSTYPVNAESASGRFLEVPFGLGVSYTLVKPVALTLEVGHRFGFAHGGDLYNDGRSAEAVGFGGIRLQPAGTDFYAISASFGLTFEL
jgi:hypothetical protein